MSEILFWIAHPTASWPGVPSPGQIINRQLSSGANAQFFGEEAAVDVSPGTRNIDEAVAITGTEVNTSYTIAAVTFNNVTLVYSNVTLGTETTIVISRPSSDVTSPGWSSTAATLSAAINESEFNDESFITSPNLTSPSPPAVLELSTALTVGTWSVDIRAQKTAGTRSIRVS